MLPKGTIGGSQMGERYDEKNIIMFPFMAQGHIIPFLALARRILDKNTSTTTNTNYTITFITTRLNVPAITGSKYYRSSNDRIRIIEIPFRSSLEEQGIPPGVENTDGLPYHLIPNFLQATLSLKPSFEVLFSHLVHGPPPPPLCVIADIFFPWCCGVAGRHGVFSAVFCGGGGFGFACFRSLWLNLPHRSTHSPEIPLPDFPEASAVHVTQMSDYLRSADGKEKMSEFNRKMLAEWSEADGILFNTVEDLDRAGLNYFRRTTGRSVWAVGPVNLPLVSKPSDSVEKSLCMKWLDSKPAKSVVYICFGSQNSISAAQMTELALALDSLSNGFIWVVRPPIGLDISSEFRAEEWLPDGFEERNCRERNRGCLVREWAPQMEILSHAAVSAFVSHCGWNSVMESLSQGVPILGWPLAAEQFYNSKLLEEEVGVCVEVARGKSVVVGHEALAAKIDFVTNDTVKGRAVRRKASDVQRIIHLAVKREDSAGWKGSSVKAMDEFLNVAALHLR